MTLDAEVRLQLGTLALEVDLVARPGSVVAVLGPNGAGKSTILRLLAGLLALDGGRVSLGGRTLDEPATGTFVPPERRRVALVPQDLLLFPHLSVLDNVAFGPRSSGASKGASRRAATPWLERVGLAAYADARPRALSGGQAQRAALARALVAEPELLLLDEPLAALDATTRAGTRRDLRHHLDAFLGCTLLVTHDPLDALMLADEVRVLEGGTITQGGTVAEVTSRPRTRYVSDLVGTNLLRGRAEGTTVRVGAATVELASPAEGDTFVTLAPSAVTIHRARPESSARNAWSVTVTAVDLLGDRVRVHLGGAIELVAEITPAALAALGLQVGDPVWAVAKATELAAYPA